MLLTSEQDVKDYLNEDLEGEDELVIDLETTGLYCWRGDSILTVSFYLPKARKTYTVPVGSGGTLFAVPTVDIDAVDWHLINTDIPTVIMHNAKFDLSFLMAAKVNLFHGRYGQRNRLIWDTIHGQWLINNQSDSLALKRLTADVEADSEEWKRYAPDGLDLELARDTAGSRASLAEVETEALVAYAETDVVLTYILYRRQWATGGHMLMELLRREMDLTWAVIDMERRGLGFDWDEHQSMKAEMERQLMEMRKQIPFDPMSGQAITNAFGTSNYQRDTLLTHVHGEQNVMARRVVAFRDLQHDYGAFCVKLATHVSADDRLHGNYRQNGTVTGRFSSNNPNMLGVPKRMRGQFVPVDPDFEFISYDLVQIELAMGAWYADCTTLLEVYESGGDVHQATADLVGVSRDIGKRLNFSMVYGVGAQTMAERLDVSLRQAQEWIRGFRRAYPELTAIKMRVEGKARRAGHVRLYNEHKRVTPEPHKAWSVLIQSAVAELAKDIIIAINAYLEEMMCGYLVLHIHDEFVVELPKGDIEMQTEIKRIIESCGPPGMLYRTDQDPWVKEE